MYISREKITKTLLLAGITLLCCGIVAVILMGVNQFKLGSHWPALIKYQTFHTYWFASKQIFFRFVS